MTQPLGILLVVTDGTMMRTFQPRGMGAYAAEVERIARALVLPDSGEATATPADRPRPPPLPAGATAMMVQSEIATAQGFTGDSCATCGNFAMKRAGTCLTCTACGSTSGCG